MKKTIDESEFVQAFNDFGREGNFSVAGLRALFEYFEQFEDDTGEAIELDVIDICCNFAEYENLKEFQADYGDNYKSLSDIEDKTSLIKIDDNSFIIIRF